MSVKIFLLATGERVISKAQEVVENEGGKKVLGYILEQPHVVMYDNDNVVSSDETGVTLDISMSPWQLLSKSPKIPVTSDLVWGIVDPIDTVVEMYTNRVFPEDSAQIAEGDSDE